MGQGQSDKEKNTNVRKFSMSRDSSVHDFVLDKSIFNSIFEKDIRRVYIYKKAERLGKAIHLITPAFAGSVSLKNRVDSIALALVDAAALQPAAARTALSRELLALSSILSIARTGGFLSPMNTELITYEAHLLLQEIAAYEEPRLHLDESPTLSHLAQDARLSRAKETSRTPPSLKVGEPLGRGHIKDIRNVLDNRVKDRREAIMAVIKNKGSVHIKDISTFIRGISEKTIQRELLSLISAGVVVKKGERRWSTYQLAN